MKQIEKMTKAQIIEKIDAIPADMLNSAVTAIRYSNPLNAISTNRVNVYIRGNRVTEIEFQSKATKANMLNVYSEILNHIAIWYGIEEARKIEVSYTPAWYDEEEAPAADTTETTTETAEAAQAAPAAQQADDITAAILGAIGAPAPAQTITATIIGPDGTPYRATYTADLLDSLRTEPRVLDIQNDETGELVYIKPDPAPTAEEPEETETTEDAPADPDAATLAAIAAIIEEAEHMRSAYFFQPPTSASSRRAYERRHSHEEITWTESGHTYTAAYTVSCTCGNIYARGEYTRDGKRTTLTAIRNSYKRLGA